MKESLKRNSCRKKQVYNLSELPWEVSGYNPNEWKLEYFEALGVHVIPEVPPVPATVPGSVQKALLDAGVLPDWNIGLNAKLCEWVENRHWIYEAELPDILFAKGETFRLKFKGLDHSGWIFLNDKEISRFNNAHIHYSFDITDALSESNNILKIVFDCPPRWLGQFGYTSEIKDWKPRWYYFWDWTSRLVQVGIWDDICLEVTDQAEIESLRVYTDYEPQNKHGSLKIKNLISAKDECRVHIKLSDSKNVIKSENINPADLSGNILEWHDLSVQPWWPNNMGKQNLYNLQVQILDKDGYIIDSAERKIGFKRIEWEQCKNAPNESEPWICIVNGKRTFLQGVNWTPIRPNFADTGYEEYEKRIRLYSELGFNSFRIWGGGFMEKDHLYDLCDEYGMMLWVDFPLSNSGLNAYAPDDPQSIKDLSETVNCFVSRQQYHTSIILWCGGNELRTGDNHSGLEHPLLKRFSEIVNELDPDTRFLPTSPYGPRFDAEKELYGKGLHWDIHGPWRPLGELSKNWFPYWQGDDSLFRSELGSPAPSSIDIINKYKGDCQSFPANADNLFWRRHPWWVDWEQFIKEVGRQPDGLEEFVNWGQKRQSDALCFAVEACKDRFPECGGIMIWIGHDCFPSNASCSIIDFEGNPKPAAMELSKILKKSYIYPDSKPQPPGFAVREIRKKKKPTQEVLKK